MMNGNEDLRKVVDGRESSLKPSSLRMQANCEDTKDHEGNNYKITWQ